MKTKLVMFTVAISSLAVGCAESQYKPPASTAYNLSAAQMYATPTPLPPVGPAQVQLVGPVSNTPAAPVAVPTQLTPAQEFLSWNMMVRAQSNAGYDTQYENISSRRNDTVTVKTTECPTC